MSGVAGGSMIHKRDVQDTFQSYIDTVLKKVPGFVHARLSGSVVAGKKIVYGDLDIIVYIEGTDKKQVKKKILKVTNSLPEHIIIPFRSSKYLGRKYYNSGEIITVLFPIRGALECIQVDNIIALTEEESLFKYNFLNLPAEKQGLVLGLVKTVLIEEDFYEVAERLGIEEFPALMGWDEEYEFNLSSSRLEVRKVKLDRDFHTLEKEHIWSTTDWRLVEKLLTHYNIEGSFAELLTDISRKLTTERSFNRVKGIFESMVSVKSGEIGTDKGHNKEKALKAVREL